MISATTMQFGNAFDSSNPAKHANVVFDNGPKMISLSCDNSGGQLTTLSRSDIRLLIHDSLSGSVEDVTNDVFGGEKGSIVRADLDTMEQAMKWLRRTNWGM